ncbi:MAG: hypothetical protein BWK73_20415 [Thiothrix lacustris]|uniref:DUF4276 family protein n=1 Tax=Thiothrix lacustris TaxID=525917 RepID=A0A1Y1QPM1_9GAMM|nr:MAG: hypothetical protein BWK73_20415 [Thiothrix lacustris]
MAVVIYVEGGGDNPSLVRKCKQGFGKLLEAKFPNTNRKLRIIPCGSRQNAYRDFKNALKSSRRRDDCIMLLVDSESQIQLHNDINAITNNPGKPWQHLAERNGDKWQRPAGATDKQCHLMVQDMEAWLIADRNMLQNHFGGKFDIKKIPVTNPSGSHKLESIPKQQLEELLNKALIKCEKKYHKGDHSFDLLSKISPDIVIAASPWAKRFFDELHTHLSI